MKVKQFFSALLSNRWEPEIIHQIPGRVRIHLPILKRIPAIFHKEIEELLSLASLIKDINSISVSILTGNILILYNHPEVVAEDVLRAFIFLNRLFLNHRERIFSNPGIDMEVLEKKLREILPQLDLKTVDTKEIQINGL